MAFFTSHREEQPKAKRRGGLGGLGTLVLVGTAAVILYEPARRTVGQFIHRQMENVLSLLLGAQVRFERLRASLLKGTIDAEGMSITRRGETEPLFTVDRMHARAAISRALRGELVVQSLDMEHPVLRIVRRADTHTNVPSRLQIDPTEAPQKANQLLDYAERAGEKLDRLGLRLDIEHALVTDGEVHFIDQTAEGFHIAAEGAMKEVSRAPDGNGYEFTSIVGSVGRRDQLAELGEVRLHGRIENITDLTQIGRARIWSDMELSDQLRIHVNCPELHSRRVEMQIDGTADMAVLHPMIPPNVPALEPLRAITRHGQMSIRTAISFDPNQGLSLSDIGGIA